METLHLDYETRSCCDLEVRGLDNYVHDPSTQVLLAAYAFGDRAVKLWQPHLAPMPEDLRDALESPFVTAYAWNVAFEREISKHVLGIDKPTCEWRDPMCSARYLSLPGSLDAAGEILGLTEDAAKLKVGKRLIKLFCEPEDIGGETTLFGISEPTFRDWRTDPKDWTLFGDYCKQDVVAERATLKKLEKFPLPESEWETWQLDQDINLRGWPIGMDVVRGAQGIVLKELERLGKRLLELTKLDNPNSGPQLLPWLRERGYGFGSLDKTMVARALNGECDMTPEATEVLILRGQTSKSSVRKYTNIADMVSADGRLRHQYTFMGAARTGRWAAHGVNVGNLPKPVKSIEKNLERAVELVRASDYEGVMREFEKPLDVITSTVRASFRATEGNQLVVADLSAIENVGIMFLSRCEKGLNVFREGRDPYLDFAMHFYKIPYADLVLEYLAGDKSKRNFCKPATLGAGFGLGAGEEGLDFDGNVMWTGLMAYARAMQVIMLQEESKKAISIFRKEYKEVKQIWKDLEQAAVRAIKNPGQPVGVGVPQTERDREYFISKGRPVDLDPILSFQCHGKKVLELKLPSGRSLHYIDPRVEESEAEYEGRKYTQHKILYYGKQQNSSAWGLVPTFGGKILENAAQGWARDILVNGMKEATAEGFSIVGSTYDEAITEERIGSHLNVDLLCECLTRKPSWMPDGVPLSAAGFATVEYRKD